MILMFRSATYATQASLLLTTLIAFLTIFCMGCYGKGGGEHEKYSYSRYLRFLLNACNDTSDIKPFEILCSFLKYDVYHGTKVYQYLDDPDVENKTYYPLDECEDEEQMDKVGELVFSKALQHAAMLKEQNPNYKILTKACISAVMKVSIVINSYMSKRTMADEIEDKLNTEFKKVLMSLKKYIPEKIQAIIDSESTISAQ